MQCRCVAQFQFPKKNLRAELALSSESGAPLRVAGDADFAVGNLLDSAAGFSTREAQEMQRCRSAGRSHFSINQPSADLRETRRIVLFDESGLFV